jgi:ribosomal protein S15P/S13E
MNKFIFIPIIVAIASCSSFTINNSFNKNNPPTESITSKTVVLKPATEIISDPQVPVIKKCSLYIPPDVPIVPLAPISKLVELPESKNNEREAILIEYIEILRKHISKSRKDHQDAYKNYIAACGKE